MKKTAISIVLGALALGMSQSAVAQDEGGDEAAAEAEDNDTAETFLAFLGLKALDGKNSIGEGTGEIEGHIIATVMAGKAASTIVTAIKDDVDDNTTVVPRSKDQQLDLSPYFILEDLLVVLDRKTTALAADAAKQCVVPKKLQKGGVLPAGVDVDGAGGDDPPDFDFDFSDVVGLARTENALSKVTVNLGESVLTNALLSASGKKGTWVIPEEISRPTDQSRIAQQLTAADNRLSPFIAGKFCTGATEANKEAKEKVKAAASKLRAEITAAKSPKDGAPSLLHRAGLIARVAEHPENGTLKRILVLRYSVDKAGGTIVNTSNLFTSVGIPGITIRGGMVITYRLVDPHTGGVEKSGTITCTMPKLLLMSVTGSKEKIDKEATCS